MSYTMANQEVRHQLTQYMNESGVMLKHIAEELGFSYNNMSSWKSGKREYSVERLHKLQNWLSKKTEATDEELINHAIEVLEAGIDNKDKVHEMTLTDHRGKHVHYVTREEYLEHMMEVALTALGMHSEAKE
jgi:transcriptional regulator with XRE-family HTH domain